MRSCKTPLLMVGIVVMSLGLLACGGDDDEPSASASSTPGVGTSSTLGATTPTAEAARTQPPDTDDDGDKSDPCSLLTPADIEAVVGFPTDEGTLVESNECMWKVGPPAEGRTVSVSVESSEMYAGQRPSDGTVDVDDIGDEAYWIPGLAWLLIRHGDDVLTVQVVITQPQDVALEAAKTLARSALERM